jgi:TRAP-type C4-dicarboxylate transport system substrate-binding protein
VTVAKLKWLALLVVITLSGCSAATTGSAPVDHAGGRLTTVTLQAVSSESADRPSGAQLKSFVDAVRKRSDGRIVIDATYGPTTGTDPDQEVIERVKDGTFDIGFAASRAFSTEGIPTFAALTTPFLIETDAAATAVVRDDSVVRPMLAGLTPAGLTGLSIFPETIRHPFGFSQPVLGPADYVGAGLRSLKSKETYAVFSALGAVPQFYNGDKFHTKIVDGSISIVESSFGLAHSVIGFNGIGTGNVAFFPRMNVLFANTRALAALTQAQRAMLRQTAVDARELAVESVPHDAAAAAQYCRGGGQVVLATDAQLAALRKKVAPYLAQMSRDVTTGRAMASISALIAKAPKSDPVRACGTTPPFAGKDLVLWPRSTGASALDGTYRTRITDATLEATGVAQSEWAEDHGTFTCTIRAGTVSCDQVAPNPISNSHVDYYVTVRGHEVQFTEKTSRLPTAVDIDWQGQWSRTADGSLQFSHFRPGPSAVSWDVAVWFSAPYVRLR